MAASELHRIIYVFDGADAFFQRAHSIEQIRHEQTVDDETGAIGGAHERLAETCGERDGGFIYFRVGCDGADYFHQLHDRHRIEKVHAQETVRTLRKHGHFGDGERRSVAGENGVFGTNFIERGPELALRGQLLDDRFDYQIGILQVFQMGGAAQASANQIAIGGSKRTFIHQALEIFFDRLQSLVEELLGHFADRNLAARLSRHLRDARAHQAAPYDPDFFDRHV